MLKSISIKQKAIDYGFDMDFVNSIKVEFTSHKTYGYHNILGKYLPLQKKIKLYDTSIDDIYPTYYHELTHALQNIELEKRYGKLIGILLYWLALTFLRGKIEKDAQEIEDRIYEHKDHEAVQPLI